ncbi:similar to Saccharomyces cerevisiae YAL020C ATS1 Protein required, with Elongator complex, Kti11p, and Kti12p, for modification of wobble nucleosides in tRNA [Maudiozyma barnettii]|uniref:Similar to Saccharomyces cerevisiae YAL020C ATS1 Protein required, with Elongator complex, Kti11p, and Kti12p, for modification of wobble nucleosides in tRNA n=1 Tax=Maudiozyma barnettii TaxID=61262 RepID=A0A8H2VH29_9SACH|nr:Ats1p [Kazachstania barnettii]CAB4255306.1 similar to Saccharomyces cerevisiae YAL020C ATS1 Protein required, with Elongator complex, Kti11p, and Kti12p, for modification of wobble nucleosides in tRNA [Kazachstania barnettii]CAD1783713.1 similar to Saccharomyces cerevisiae YAL020C ATS1 Protein required, with Elongator complex, Kti11p, and Kti12p, for modification of wobble nucleosides in tRNA [Kazachstania barnettii]
MLQVYAFGSNGNFQLGLGHADDIIVPQLTLSLDVDKDVTVKKVACGGNHTLLLLSNGNVYECGSNAMGQLCDDSQIETVPKWSKLDMNNIKDIACGWEFTVVLDILNNVWIRGYGPKGELGLGSNTTKITTFQKIMNVPENSNCKLFTSFQNCALLVQRPEGGSVVYGWGSNTKCQLMNPKSKSVFTPTIIYESDSQQIVQVAMGKNFLLLIDNEGRIVSTRGAIPESFQLDEWKDKKGLEVYTMWSSIHIYYENKIYSFGFGIHGQIFDNDYFQSTVMNKHTSKLIAINTGSEHGMLVVQDDIISGFTVYCWGWGEHGNCGRVKEEQSDDKPVINDYSNLSSKANEIMHVDSVMPSTVFGGCASTWIVKYD